MKITADYNNKILTIRKTIPNTEYMGLVYEIPCKNIKEAKLQASEHIKFLENMYGLEPTK